MPLGKNHEKRPKLEQKAGFGACQKNEFYAVLDRLICRFRYAEVPHMNGYLASFQIRGIATGYQGCERPMNVIWARELGREVGVGLQVVPVILVECFRRFFGNLATFDRIFSQSPEAFE
jgi:hypothetical protein